MNPIYNAITIIGDFFQRPDNSQPSAYKRNLSAVISPTALDRIRHDILMWREALAEAEQGYIELRQRVKLQRMYVDTVLNEHVYACIDARYRMLKQREFTTGNEDLDKVFKKAWFYNLLQYAIDAKLYGYTLISLGNIENDEFKNLTFVRRENVSPDRRNVTTFMYSMSGTSFMEDPQKLWHIWIPTPTDTGVSDCGYGLLYRIAKTEILLRNNTTYNADFQEMYGQPMRKGKTNKTDQTERDTFFQALLDMGHRAAILLDQTDGDDVELVEAKSAGTGWQGFENFEKRLEAKISKVILGHASALDEVPGKLGATQGGEKSPARLALDEINAEDAKMAEDIANTELIPRMIALGFNIPLGTTITFLNNNELSEIRDREDKSNQATATIVKTLKDGGYEVDEKYITERTGIPVKKAEAPLPTPGLTKEIKNKLMSLYGRIQ